MKAQLYEIPLEMKIEKADLIVEGEVIHSQSYTGADGEIYTAHQVEISQILKGADYIEPCLTVVTMGGEADGHISTWSHMLTLEKGEKGIFFLHESQKPAIVDKDFPRQAFEAYSGLQGFLKFRQENGKTVATDPFHEYENLQAQLFDKIEQSTGEKAVRLLPETVVNGLSLLENCLIYSIEPILQFAQNPAKIGADIKVRVQSGSAKLYQSLVVVEYDTTFFGSNIATSGNLELYNGDISGLSVYSLSATNLAPNKLQLKLQTVGSTTNLYTVTENKSWLVRIFLNIENPFGTAKVAFDHAAMAQGNLYYNQSAAEPKRFECIKIENEIMPIVCPQITSFTPKVAAGGVGSMPMSGVPGIITITGSNFGTPSGTVQKPVNYRVGFTNAGAAGGWVYPPERDYVSWTNTQIVVKVPAAGFDDNGNFSFNRYAGTGPIKVERTDMDSCWAIGDTLYVPFVAQNSVLTFPSDNTNQSIPIKLSNRDGDGGYSLYSTDAFKNLPGATGAFTRALNTWRCNVFVNFDIRELGDIPDPDGACEIDYGPLPAGTASTRVALITATPQPCSNDNSHNFLPKFKIIFYSNIDTSQAAGGEVNLFWYTGENEPNPELNYFDTLDLETIALHELGHALLLRHTLNKDNVMYPPAKKTVRDLTGDDSGGGHHLVRLSHQAPNCQGVMDTLTMGDCMLNKVHEAELAELFFKVYPNPAGETINVESKMDNHHLRISQAVVVDASGHWLSIQRMETNQPFPIKLEVGALPPGIYHLILYTQEGQTFSQKFIKH